MHYLVKEIRSNKLFHLLQNTNGVNFYNILTQNSDDMVKSTSGQTNGYLGEETQHAQIHFLCYIDKNVLIIILSCFFTASLKRRHIRPLHRQSLSELMNGPIRQKLGVIPKNVTWGGNYSFL